MHPYGLSANVMLCGSSDFKAAPALPLDQAAKSVPNPLLPAKPAMSDLLCPFFDACQSEEQSDSEEATSPRGSEYSFSLLFRGESASEPATPGAR